MPCMVLSVSQAEFQRLITKEILGDCPPRLATYPLHVPLFRTRLYTVAPSSFCVSGYRPNDECNNSQAGRPMPSPPACTTIQFVPSTLAVWPVYRNIRGIARGQIAFSVTVFIPRRTQKLMMEILLFCERV